MSLTIQQLQAEAKYGQPGILLSIWSFDVCDFIQIIKVLVCIEATKDNTVIKQHSLQMCCIRVFAKTEDLETQDWKEQILLSL